jgi:hypothetical protein
MQQVEEIELASPRLERAVELRLPPQLLAQQRREVRVGVP